MEPATAHDHHQADQPDANTVNPTLNTDRALPPMLTAPEAAHLLRVRAPQLYALARAGTIPSVRVGRAVRFNRDRLFQWIEAGGAITAGGPT